MDSISSSGTLTPEGENCTNQFTAHECLPNAGFSLLCKAKRHGKWFILKGLKPEYANKTAYRQLLDKEFDLMLPLEHQNIVAVVDRVRDSVVGDCIVMEYVDGVTLREFLRTKPSAKVRLRIVYELLDALAFVHAKQIVHRDLKPSNILVTRNGAHVKIIDFGLSDSDSHAILKQPAGSREYAAPEQLRGDCKIDCRADVYAVGKLLRLIFPHRFGHIARRCMRHNREQRYADCSAVRRAIDRTLMLTSGVSKLALFVALVALALWAFRRPQTETVPMAHTVDTLVVQQRDTVVRTRDFTPAQQQMIDAAQRHISRAVSLVVDSIERGQIASRQEAYASQLRLVRLLAHDRDSISATIPINSLFHQQFVNAWILISDEQIRRIHADSLPE